MYDAYGIGMMSVIKFINAFYDCGANIALLHFFTRCIPPQCNKLCTQNLSVFPLPLMLCYFDFSFENWIVSSMSPDICTHTETEMKSYTILNPPIVFFASFCMPVSVRLYGLMNCGEWEKMKSEKKHLLLWEMSSIAIANSVSAFYQLFVSTHTERERDIHSYRREWNHFFPKEVEYVR